MEETEESYELDLSNSEEMHSTNGLYNFLVECYELRIYNPNNSK